MAWVSTVGVCGPQSRDANLRDPHGQLQERSELRLPYVSRLVWSSWASKKGEDFVWTKQGFSSPRRFDCKANREGTVVLQVRQIVLWKLNPAAR